MCLSRDLKAFEKDREKEREQSLAQEKKKQRDGAESSRSAARASSSTNPKPKPNPSRSQMGPTFFSPVDVFARRSSHQKRGHRESPLRRQVLPQSRS